MFFAYPNRPDQIGETIENAARLINQRSEKIKTWKATNVVGSFIGLKVEENIEKSELFIADISKLNFNVTFEIGFAIGKGKSIILVSNSSVDSADSLLREIGIFDTIGFESYSNSNELINILDKPIENSLLDNSIQINKRAPIYLLEQKFKTDYAVRITTRIKKARITYRSFDPNESPRLSAQDAIKQVQQSLGVIVSLLSVDDAGHAVHNFRAAFIAGLARGMDKSLCILQHNDDPVPIDYRDFVNTYFQINDIDNYIADFAASIAEAFQADADVVQNNKISSFQKIDFGASAAENEMRYLQSYYLRTETFNKTLRGDVQLVVGRKGSGKTAIFLQIRDRERSKGNNIVLDLKPEGYKLIKFKELVLSYLQEGTFQHTISAFWEYILLLEICHKILETDKVKHINNSTLFELYKKVEDSYNDENYLTEGDFSERMSKLMDKLNTSYREKYGDGKHVRLSTPEISDLIYKSDIRKLRSTIIAYLKQKDKVWLLLDNIDKGWPSSGLKREDFIIIRTLIDALRNIQRQFNRERIDMYPVVFLRNDVYELLMEQTADRQKESKEVIDWLDSDLLRELLKLRILSNYTSDSTEFTDIWRQICVSHYKGEETSQYLIDRSLLRPRFLINLVSQCKSFAINFNHKRIEIEDIEKGFNAFSSDLLIDINYEIRDMLPEAENILYAFIASSSSLNYNHLTELVASVIQDKSLIDKIIDLLLWYGFLGIQTNYNDVKYIYNVNYNMSLLKGLSFKYKDNLLYSINPAFWPALLIE